MSTDFNDIESGWQFLYSIINTALSGIPTHYMNKKYTPVVGTAYVRQGHAPAPVTFRTMGSGGEDEHTGFFTLDLFYPASTGQGAAIQAADIIRSTISRSGGRVEDEWYILPVSVEYRARTFRS